MRKISFAVIRAGLFAAAVSYVLLLIFSPYLHNHVIDGKVHSDCPAYMWSLVSSCSITVIGSIVAVFIFVQAILTCSLEPAGTVRILRKFARSPPSVFSA